MEQTKAYEIVLCMFAMQWELENILRLHVFWSSHVRQEGSNLLSGVESKLWRILCCIWMYPGSWWAGLLVPCANSAIPCYGSGFHLCCMLDTVYLGQSNFEDCAARPSNSTSTSMLYQHH